MGKIKYKDCDKGIAEAEYGELLYIKPVLTADKPVDDFNYAQTHTEFPHESTSDQWFDEAQFESYRKLGEHSLVKFTKFDLTMEKLFRKANQMHQGGVERALEVLSSQCNQ